MLLSVFILSILMLFFIRWYLWMMWTCQPGRFTVLSPLWSCCASGWTTGTGMTWRPAPWSTWWISRSYVLWDHLVSNSSSILKFMSAHKVNTYNPNHFPLSLNYCCVCRVTNSSCSFVELLTALRCLQTAHSCHFHLPWNYQYKHKTIPVYWGSWQQELPGWVPHSGADTATVFAPDACADSHLDFLNCCPVWPWKLWTHPKKNNGGAQLSQSNLVT